MTTVSHVIQVKIFFLEIFHTVAVWINRLSRYFRLITVAIMKQRNRQMNGANSHEPQTASVKQDSPDNGSGMSFFYRMIHEVLVPLFLILFVPNLMLMLWFTAVYCQGSYLQLIQHFIQAGGFLSGINKIWAITPFLSPFSVAVLSGYILWCLLTMRLLPGKRIEGPVTPNGHVPVYKDNGFLCYLVTMAAFCLLSFLLKYNGSSITVVYDRFNELLATISIFSFIFCLFLYFKGLWWPSGPDHGSSGNPLFDYYWGTELYPRILGFDVKVFTNCRFGMTAWPLLVCIFAMKSHELHGFRDSMLVTTILQMLYLTKFFWWEGGYYQTIDIILDRAGFYICWGCLVYVPGLYACVSLYMVNQSVDMGLWWSMSLLVLGMISLYVNYDADAQKSYVRGKRGRCSVWGRPAKVIEAKYQLASGEEKTSILLASGYWGLSRHFHYIPELTLSFCWSATTGFSQVMPFTYFLWLLMLLTHRSFRDDWKCRAKYGDYWKQYCELVPQRIIPYIF